TPMCDTSQSPPPGQTGRSRSARGDSLVARPPFVAGPELQREAPAERELRPVHRLGDRLDARAAVLVRVLPRLGAVQHRGVRVDPVRLVDAAVVLGLLRAAAAPVVLAVPDGDRRVAVGDAELLGRRRGDRLLLALRLLADRLDVVRPLAAALVLASVAILVG